jgi:hypothetical protein
MNEQLFYWLSFCIIFLFGFLLGCFVAAKFQIFIKFAKKEDYEEKVKQLEDMIETMQKPAELDLKPSELFPPGVSPEYGLPRKLTKD